MVLGISHVVLATLERLNTLHRPGLLLLSNDPPRQACCCCLMTLRARLEEHNHPSSVNYQVPPHLQTESLGWLRSGQHPWPGVQVVRARHQKGHTDPSQSPYTQQEPVQTTSNLEQPLEVTCYMCLWPKASQWMSFILILLLALTDQVAIKLYCSKFKTFTKLIVLKYRS